MESEPCPYCGHPMTEHFLFPGDYEQPAPEVWCESEEINPRTLTVCQCAKSPRRSGFYVHWRSTGF